MPHGGSHISYYDAPSADNPEGGPGWPELVERTNPSGTRSSSRLFTTDRAQYDAFIAAGGAPDHATFVDMSSAETLDAFYESYGGVPNLEGADPDSEDGDDASDPPMQVKGTTPNPELEAMYSDFVATMQSVGITQQFASKLWDWAKEQLVDPNYSITRLAVDVYDTEAFQQRFPAITEQRKMENVTPFTPAEYIDYESDVLEYLSRYSVAGQSLDFDNLVTNLIVNNVGTAEVENRLQAAQRVLGNVPDEVRQTYIDWYGPEVAEANLMKTFLDPSDEWAGSWADVSAATSAAEVGGWAKQRLRFDKSESLRQSMAESIGRQGLSSSAIWENLDLLRAREDLFRENLDEVINAKISEEGLAGQFGLDRSAEELLTRRAETRAAKFGGAGGALVSGGTTGFGAANA